MISKQDFINKIKTKVFPELLLTEKERKDTLWKGIFVSVFSLLFYFFYLLFIPEEANQSEIMDKSGKLLGFLLVIIFVCGFPMVIWHDFISKQKKSFSPIFLKFLENLKDSQDIINKSLLHHTCLFSEFDSSTYDDCISGSLKKADFSIAETKLVYKAGTNKKNILKTSIIVFRGICIAIPMKIPVSGYTLLFNTKFPQKFPILNKISLEDTTFKKNYQVFSDNQIDARVLLTPAFMERLNALKKCFRNKRIDVSFFGNHAVFAIHTNQDLFESYSLFRTVTNIKTYEKFYDEIKSIHDLIDILNINNASLPTGLTFNAKLYKQISAIKKKRSERLPLVLLAKFFRRSAIFFICLVLILGILGVLFTVIDIISSPL